MLIIGSVLAALAALLHVAIFAMESLSWTGERTRAIFGTSLEEAQATREMALNQGFYNLFLSIIAGLGAILTVSGARTTGPALILAGTASMLAAALVLFCSSPGRRGAALKQGVLPLLSVALVVLALI